MPSLRLLALAVGAITDNLGVADATCCGGESSFCNSMEIALLHMYAYLQNAGEREWSLTDAQKERLGELISEAKSQGVSRSSAIRWNNQWIEQELINKENHGNYRKVA